jgi:hypothetical protein
MPISKKAFSYLFKRSGRTVNKYTRTPKKIDSSKIKFRPLLNKSNKINKANKSNKSNKTKSKKIV